MVLCFGGLYLKYLGLYGGNYPWGDQRASEGEVEAAKAYGMSRFQTYQRIILPSALRRSLPAYSNEVIFMLHGSAVAGIVTIMDLTGAARLVNSRYYAPFEAF